MADKKIKLPQTNPKDESRVFPLLVAGLFCFVLAALLGIGSWRVFGSQARANGDTARYLRSVGLESLWTKEDQKPEVAVTEVTPDRPVNIPEKENVEDKTADNDTETSKEIEGVVSVVGQEVRIGGGETKRPVQRIIVEDFLIAETEVTNAQYAEFIEATNYRSPIGWNKSTFPKDTEDFPVANVSWSDANAFCEWLGEKYKMKVRLPSQAEWELAAGGPKQFKYPWGNDWNDDGVEKKKDSRPNKVKKYPINKSLFGAYDMLGNVWEWTSEQITRKEMESEVAKNATSKDAKIYLILGGSFIEDRKKLRISFWAESEFKIRSNFLGFRYVIIPKQSNNVKKEESIDDTK